MAVFDDAALEDTQALLAVDPILRRLAEAGVTAAPDTALVLASAGSSDATANAVITRAAQTLAERGPWLRVVAAHASAAWLP